MNISEIFIKRPVATSLLAIAVAISGIMAYTLLPVSPLPSVDFPTISVNASLPGASPETMASAVATPLERQFGRISGVTEMTSVSNLGSTSITMQFDLSRNIDAAGRDVQSAINAARAQLPTNLPGNPSYRKVNPADAPIMILALTSETIPTASIYDAASSLLQQKLSQVQGVGQVTVGGGALPAVRVDVNPSVLNAYGIGMDQVRAVLSAANANRPKGQLSDGDVRWQIDTTDQMLHAVEYRPLIVSYNNGSPVRLGDVADVEDSVENTRTLGLANGSRSVSIIVFRQPGANIIETVDRVKALIPELRASISPAINLWVASDRTTTIRASVHDVEITLLISTILVILVVFLFLRSVRVTFIPGIAIPLSLTGTFGIMYLLGYSLDNLSLMALTISTGFVIDDAIVVIENITRYREQGYSSLDAAIRGSREIGFTVLSMSTSLIAVFIPILLMGGIVGRLFREFAVTLSAAIVVSLLVSLTTTPTLCAKLLRPESEEKHGSFSRMSEAAFNKLLAGYERGLRWVLRHPSLTLTVTILTICLNILLYTIVPKGFFPQQDTGMLNGNVQARQDISFQAMREKLLHYAKIVKSDPAVENVIAFTGGGGSTTNTARMFVMLKPQKERKITADRVIARIRGKSAAVPGSSLFLQSVQDIRVGGRSSGSTFQYTLRGDSLSELNQWSPKVLAALKGLPELTDVNTDQQNRGLEADLELNRDLASRLDVTAAGMDQTLYDAFGQRQVSTMYSRLNQYHVVMEAGDSFLQSPDTLKDLYVRSGNGAAVPLASFTKLAQGSSPMAVNHQGQFPASTISFNLAPHVALGDAVQSIEAATQKLGMPAGILGTFAGTAQAFQDSLKSQPLLILTALLAVYIVLGMLYESLVHPITILSTLPSAGIGAMIALLICGMELSVIAIIGIILLIGIVKKNAIMMIDFALDVERKENKPPEEAIYQACVLRFRPIMMTTMAALLGGVPVALASGAGSELRRPLGVAIVGGLIVSQSLTLFTTPVVYLYLDRARLWFSRFRKHTAVAAAMLALAVFFVGCSLGPKYERPTTPVSPAYKETGDALEGWKTAQPNDTASKGKWWEFFGDPQLNALEEKIDLSNQNVKLAEAQFREARALVHYNLGGKYPTASATASVNESRSSETRSSGAITTQGNHPDYLLRLDASYELDVWGRVRNQVANSVANAQASAADLESVRLSIQAELAMDFFQLRALENEKKLLDSSVGDFEKALQLTQYRYQGGVASGVDVAEAQTQLETARVQATEIDLQRASTEHAIAVLVGEPPSTFSMEQIGELVEIPSMNLPGLPTELLERRPDVASAERSVMAANANIGVAKAAYFPTLTLDASAGLESGVFSKWLSIPSRFWSVGPALVESLFEGGRRKALVQQNEAAYDQTVATYRQTVLSAIQEVEDNLAALRFLRLEADQQSKAVDAASKSVSLSIDRYKSGIASYLEVVAAQSILLSNQRNQTEIQRRRIVAEILLIKALGGGWDSSHLPQPRDL